MTTEITPEMEKAIIQLMKSALSHKKHDILCKEQIAAYKHQHYLDTKDENAIQQHLYYLKTIEKRSAYNRQHYLENREQRLTRQNEYTHENKDKILIYMQQYYLAHPEIAKANNARRRARISASNTSFTSLEFRVLCDAYENVCVYCGEKASLGPDHIIPLAKGGNNNIENILPACRSCNCSKGMRDFEEFVKLHTQTEVEGIYTRIYLAECASEPDEEE